MWPFDQSPASSVERTLGVRLTPTWLSHLRLSSVRLTNGCSGAIVSRGGLVLTNAHCVLPCAQSLSTAGADYVRDGFLTDRRSQERACPGIQAEILVDIIDATNFIFKASAGKFGDAFVTARLSAIGKAEHDVCGGEPRLRCQLISFFGGGQFKVYEYRIYDDVRLVFSPEYDAAFFGGEGANFTFPRHDFDAAFLRLYDHGKPATPTDGLAFARKPPLLDDAVFIAGNPGVTQRSATVAELEVERDLTLPRSRQRNAALRASLAAFAKGDPAGSGLVAERLFELDNLLDVVDGRLRALRDQAFMDDKRTREAGLRAAVAADPRLRDQIGDPWAEIAAAEALNPETLETWAQLETGAGGGSQLFAYARGLVRAGLERAKPSAERLTEFADSRVALARKQILDDRPAPAAVERLYISAWLTGARAGLGPLSPEVAVLGADNPDATAARLVDGTRLADPAVRAALWNGGLAAILASSDPMIVYALAMDPAARAARHAYENAVEGPVQQAGERIARARFVLEHGDIYPDATFSLRLSWGRVRGVDGGSAFTTFGDLFAHATRTALPPRWATATPLDPTTVLNFTSTNDIAGGNSGSPVVNAHGDLVGVAFDGNAASLAGDFTYDAAQNRAVSLSAVALAEALDKVYGRKALLRELDFH